ncbi:MAG: sporulation integral membrane protein YtvI [Gracilibacteraceae bacterium]|jgi:sporulation integral membrane protein YtvI|nr:sporulation integral membrane protein YtvI [Gracilibacteraceae bacterium]
MAEPVQERHKHLYIRLLLRIVLFVLVCLFLVYVLPSLLSLFAPFLAAFVVALVLNPLVTWIHRKTRLPRRLAALVLVVLVFAGLAALVSWGVYIFVGEMVSLAKDYQTAWAYLSSAFDYLYTQFTVVFEIFPQIKDFSLMDSLYDWIQRLSQTFLDSPYSNIATFSSKVGNAVVVGIIFMIAAYIFTAEYRAISDLMERYFGNRIYGYMRLLKNSTQSALWRYLRAQLLLALLAFVVMFVALLIYGQPYAFLIALSLGFVDLLPIVGTVIILVPWAIVEYVGGDVIKGIFLLALGGGFFVLRRFVEPKVLGSQTGLHPLVALGSVYLGFKMAGVLGAIFGPVVIMVAISINNTHVFDNTIKDFKDVLRHMARFLHREDLGQEDNGVLLITDDGQGAMGERAVGSEGVVGPEGAGSVGANDSEGLVVERADDN